MIQVWIPAVGRNCEFILPVSMKIEKAIQSMIRLLQEEYPEIQTKASQFYLLEKQNFLALNPLKKVEECEMTDGKEYILL